MKYAKETTVSVEKSRVEIEALVRKYGASGFMSGWQGNAAMVAFEMRDRRVKFVLPVPDKGERRFTHVRRNGWDQPRTAAQSLEAWEQACRQRWRALALSIKAKLEAVESGIASFESEWLPYIVTSDGMTIGEKLLPRLNEIASTGTLPPLLPGPAN